MTDENLSFAEAFKKDEIRLLKKYGIGLVGNLSIVCLLDLSEDSELPEETRETYRNKLLALREELGISNETYEAIVDEHKKEAQNDR